MKYTFLLISLLSCSYTFTQNELTDSINRILASFVKSELDPGITVGIVKNGHTIFIGSKGCMNLEYNLPFNDSTVFPLASITKQFTSACIGILESRGDLSIADDVRKYIPEMMQYDDTIRISHLLNHTSGIRNHNVLLDLKGFDYKHQGYTNDMIQELMFKQKGVNNRPGEKMLYSNTNYVLLALIIERVSGMKIHEFAKQELFEPLQMEHTFFNSNLTDVIKNVAHPYYTQQGKLQESKSLTLCVGAGGMMSTIPDLVKWSTIFIDTNHPFSYLKAFITQLDTLNNGTLMNHGRGMFVSPYKGFTTFNHSGRDLGMRSQLICVPDKGLTVIVFSNSENINAVAISYQLLDLFLAEREFAQKTADRFYISNQEMASFVGTYQELNSDLRMDIVIENDTLKGKSSFGRTATPLIAENSHSFYRLDNSSVRYEFSSSSNSEDDLRVDFGGAVFYFEKIELDPYPNQNLSDYVGKYYSAELDVVYEIELKNNKLELNFPHNEGLILTEGISDTFGANKRTKYVFNRDKQGRVISFSVSSEGTVKNILFVKLP